MRKQKLSIHILASIIICALLLFKTVLQVSSLVISIFSIPSVFSQEASSIGIIGGFDGPTTIFLSSPFRYIFVLPIIELIGIAYVLVVLIINYRIRKIEYTVFFNKDLEDV